MEPAHNNHLEIMHMATVENTSYVQYETSEPVQYFLTAIYNSPLHSNMWFVPKC